MVAQHYRWDFIQLSTDEKPTPATSEKVANGSTLYTSDDSKYYVWYKDQWYEKTGEEPGPGPGPGPVDTSNNINFYDLDGNIVASWTLEELADKTELPENPEAPEGLTAKGWNWTLAQLQAEDAPMNVGQLYGTTDDKTHIFVSVDAAHLEPYFGLGVNGTITVDWGDDTEPSTLTGSSVDTGQTVQHIYAEPGDYEVIVDVPAESSARIRGSTSVISYLWRATSTVSTITAEELVYSGQVRKIWIGKRIDFVAGGLTRLGLSQLTFPDDYSGTTLPNYFLQVNQAYKSAVILPPSITSIGTNFMATDSTFNNIICFPPALTSIGNYAMTGCYTYNKTITFPKSLKTIGGFFLAGSTSSPFTKTGFNSKINLNNVTNIGEHFLHGAANFNQDIDLSSVVVISNEFMVECYSFNKTLTIPSSATTIGSGFMASCYSFTNLIVNADTVGGSASLSVTYPICDEFLKGVTISGTGASAWLTALTNSYTSPYRKVIDGRE